MLTHPTTDFILVELVLPATELRRKPPLTRAY